MARVLILGASGLLGSNLAADWSPEHEVIGTYHRHPVHIEGVDLVRTDLASTGSVERLIETQQPEWIVNCAAATNLDACEVDPDRAEVLNHLLAGWIATGAREIGARLVHVSTDAVFDGRTGGYREDDPTAPLSVYGRTKLAGERAVLAAYPRSLVVRTNIFGWNKQPKTDLAEWFLANLEAGTECPGFSDVYFSPLLVNHLGALILAMLHAEVAGLFHIGGKTCLSKFDFGVRLATAVGADPGLVRPSSVEAASLRAPRAKKLCLNSSKAEQVLGRSFPEIDQGVEQLLALRSWRSRAESEVNA